MGKWLFGILSWLSLAGALLTGLFFTSDCLSEEKREGTLGFLFLTDLRGYDVVLGKLLSSSLRCFYALLAVFPILGVSLLMGGVTGSEFGKVLLALWNALLVSLLAGLFISSVSRESQKALAATVLLLVVWAGGGPAIDGIIALIQAGQVEPAFSLSSPIYLFLEASVGMKSLYWKSLLANQGLVLLLLVLASSLIPRTWQDKSSAPTAAQGLGYRMKFGSVKRRLRLRRKLLALNPVLWLACRERWQSAAFWIISITIGIGLIAAGYFNKNFIILTIWSYVSGAFALAFYLGIASHAGRLFVETRKNGLMELLLVTPFAPGEIVTGQCRAFVRMFGVPLILYVLAQFIGSALVQHHTWKTISNASSTATNSVTGISTNTTGQNYNSINMSVTVTNNASVVASKSSVPAGMRNAFDLMGGIWVAGLTAFFGALVFVSNTVALIWFGMWMGLTSKTTNLATLKTIAFVQIIPWFAASFASALLLPLLFFPLVMNGFGGTGSVAVMAWFPVVSMFLSSLLFIGKDVGFILWSRKKLYSEHEYSGFAATAKGSIATMLPVRRT